jgi:DNA-binding NarL/FixJ family response regulator
MNKEKIKVFIVDDHDFFREGIKLLLSCEEIAEIYAEAVNGKDFLEKLEKVARPDIILMDISMPEMDGIEASRIALEKHPDLKIITLTMFGDEKYFYQMIKSGVKGFLLKSGGISELLNAIKDVYYDKSFFSNELLLRLFTSLKSQFQREEEIIDSGHPLLNPKEIEVLKLIAQGKTHDEISEVLHMSDVEIRTSRLQILKKTACSNTASLVIYAIKNKYVAVG